MNRHEEGFGEIRRAAIVDLGEWVGETGQGLPRLAGAIVGIEGDCVIDLETGELELLTEDWVVFVGIWRRECERRLQSTNYNCLAVALERADTGRVLGQPGQWESYLNVAGLLLETGK